MTGLSCAAASDRSITVRVIGGEGDDVLEDSSRVAHGAATHFYDASGRNTFVRGSRTRVVTKPFVTVPPKRSLDDEEEDKPEEDPRVLSEERRGRFRDLMPDSDDFIESKTSAGIRYWGESSGWMPFAGYRESGGVVLGFGPTVTDYGFRRRPYAWQAGVRGMVGTRNGDLGIRLTADRHLENSPWSVSLFAHATQLESNRFYGYGNDTERVDPSLSLITRDELLVLPSLCYSFSTTSALAFGPVIKYVDPEIPTGSPAESRRAAGQRALRSSRRARGSNHRQDHRHGSAAIRVWPCRPASPSIQPCGMPKSPLAKRTLSRVCSYHLAGQLSRCVRVGSAAGAAFRCTNLLSLAADGACAAFVGTVLPAMRPRLAVLSCAFPSFASRCLRAVNWA